MRDIRFWLTTGALTLGAATAGATVPRLVLEDGAAVADDVPAEKDETKKDKITVYILNAKGAG